MPRLKLLGVLFVRLMVLEEVDFRRQGRKAALRGRGRQSTGEQQPELCCGPAANPDWEWEQALADSRSKGNLSWEQGREHSWSYDKPSFGQICLGLLTSGLISE